MIVSLVEIRRRLLVVVLPGFRAGEKEMRIRQARTVARECLACSRLGSRVIPPGKGRITLPQRELRSAVHRPGSRLRGCLRPGLRGRLRCRSTGACR